MEETVHNPDLTVRWLQPEQVRARWDADAVRLTLCVGDGPEFLDAGVTLAFPVTEPEGYVELSGGKGESLGILKTLEGLDEGSRRALREALKGRYMIPHVSRIVEVAEVSPFVLKWRVETDRGSGTFFTESPRESVRYLGHDRIRLTDLAGNHYDIRSLVGLDLVSRSILESFL